MSCQEIAPLDKSVKQTIIKNVIEQMFEIKRRKLLNQKKERKMKLIAIFIIEIISSIEAFMAVITDKIKRSDIG